MKRYIFLLILFFVLSGTLSAKVTLPALVSNNMVLQQQSKVKIWGWSEPNAQIEVSPSWGENVTTKSDDEGNWIVTVATPGASFTPYVITVSDGEPVIINNVLIGEVWLCSGQSNMEMTLSGIGPSGVKGAIDAITEAGSYPDVRLFTVAKNSATEPQKDCKGQWELSSPETAKSFSAVGYFYAIQLQKVLKVPVGIINSSWSATIIEAWMDAESQKPFTDIDLNLLYDEKVMFFNKPISAYNGMIIPLFNYKVRGFLWYQGEANVPRYTTYADKLVALIKLWRSKWDDNDLPFFYAEIAPCDYKYHTLDMTKAQTKAAFLREQQNRVLKIIDNVGMVCTNDLVQPYELNEIHPTDKLSVAKRFSCLAFNRVYGYGDIVPATNLQYESMKVEGNKAKITFSNGGKTSFFGSKGEITGFEIAGSDKVFYRANAIKENTFARELIVTSDKVPDPVAVRYCFRNFLIGNVFNAFGMPLIPFRTDNWEEDVN